MLDPDRTFISLSKTAGSLLMKLGIVPSDSSVSDIKRAILGAYRDGQIKTVDSTKELHFLAESCINGVDCFLICVCMAGSPADNKEFTTIVKGVMLPNDARELLRMGKGLAPIGRTISANRRYEDSNDA